MNGYPKPGILKISLFLAGLLLMAMPLFYSNYLGQKLAELELNKIKLFERTLVEITNTENLSLGEDFSFEFEMLQEIIRDLQIVVINRSQQVDLYNFEAIRDTAQLIQTLKDTGPAPFVSEDYTIYYKYPFTITLLKYFPLFQFFLLVLYAAFGYAIFNAARREEQNRVWVGMAKETAHQLGTPISGMMGWIEALQTTGAEEDKQYIVEEMSKDVEKLQLVADRFSKIGSTPELHQTDLYPLVEKSMQYIAARASKNITFSLLQEGQRVIEVQLNPNLFSWVLENVLRNALDAMDQKGSVSIHLVENGPWIQLDITDSGKGIPVAQRSEVFKPGFTTKKRGWGLGLSLSKRIIENYHRGKIFIKSSEPGKGTTISIQLPRIS